MKARLTASLLLALSLVGCDQPGTHQTTFPSTLQAVEQATVEVPALPIVKWETEHGVPVLFVPRTEVPMVDINIGFDAGSSRDGDKPGLAAFVSDLFNEGTDELSLEDIVNGFNAVGANFRSRSSSDMAAVSLRTLSDESYFEPALTLFLTVLSNPVYPQAAVQRHRQRLLQQFERERQTPQTQLSDRYRQLVYGEHHPYAQRQYGTADTLPQLTPQTLTAFHRQHYTRASAVISLVGDLNEAQARALAERISHQLPAGNRLPALDKAKPRTRGVREFIEFPSEQTWFAIGNQAIWRNHEDWPALYLANEILGGSGFGSLLMEEVREKRGYVYGISSYFSRLLSAGPFTVQFQTRADNASDALQVTLEVIQQFIAEGVSEQRLKETVTATLNEFVLSNTDNASLSNTLLAYGYYDLPLDYQQQFVRQLQSLSAREVAETFARHINPEHFAIVAAGRSSPFNEHTPANSEQPDNDR